MRKAFVLIATAALLLGGAGFMVSSASGTNTKDTLRIRAVDVAEQFVDNGQAGFSQGDQIVFTSDLYAGTRKVGYDGGTCTVVRLLAEGSVLHCVGTNSLPGGQVTVQGFVPASSTGAIQPFQLAITGGTQRYRRAHGQVDGRAISDAELDLTLRIER